MRNLKGFTLVELLIVIGLLGALALIVISAINPIEQANRTRDTRFKTDGGQIISAVDRYFASHSSFPWEDTSGSELDSDSAYGFITAGDVGVGLCGDAGCSTDGLLISTDELKTEFRSRDFIEATSLDEQLMIGKSTGASSSIYACFIPKSKAFRSKAANEGKVYTIDLTTGAKTPTEVCGKLGGTLATDWTTPKCYVCIPE